MKANTLLAALLAAGALSVSGAVQAQDASGGSASGSSGSMQSQMPGSSDTAAQSGSQMPGSSDAASGSMTSGSMASGSGMQPDQMSEDDVRKLQQALADQGQDVDVDGIWGPNTQTALREFQRQQGIDATGQPDQETLSALDVQTDGMAEAGGTGGSSLSPPTGSSGASSQ